jgi:hypothetical protein
MMEYMDRLTHIGEWGSQHLHTLVNVEEDNRIIEEEQRHFQ